MDFFNSKKCKVQWGNNLIVVVILLLLFFSCKKDEQKHNENNNNGNTLNYKPSVYIVGRNQGKKGIEYEFKILSYRFGYSYIFDWGDGTINQEASYGDYGGPTTVRHIWTSAGTFNVRIKEKNNWTYKESLWTDPFTIHICDDCYTYVYKGYMKIHGMAVHQLPNGQIPYGGNIILANVLNYNNTDILLLKTNVSAEIIWSKALGQPNKNENIRASIANNDNIIILCSNCVYKVDYMGEIIYYAELDGFNAEKIISTKDGNYLICGSLLNSEGEEIAFVSKLNNYFQQIWIKTLNQGKALSVLENDDGSIVVWLDNMKMTKFDANGTLLWQNNYSNGQETTGRGYILKSNDGNYLASCLVSTNNGNTKTVHILKISPTGALIYNKELASIKYNEFNIESTKDNGFILYGSAMNTNNMPGSYVAYQKLNNNADVIWSKLFNINDYSIEGSIYGVSVTSDNKFIFTGYVFDRIPYSLEYSTFLLLMKTDEYGNAPIP